MNAEMSQEDRIRMAHYGKLGLHPNTDSRTFCNREGCACGLPTETQLLERQLAEAQARMGLEEVKAALGKAEKVGPPVELVSGTSADDDGHYLIKRSGWYKFDGKNFVLVAEDIEDNGGYRMDEDGQVISKRDLEARQLVRGPRNIPMPKTWAEAVGTDPNMAQLLQNASDMADRFHERIMLQNDVIERLSGQRVRLVNLCNELVSALTTHDSLGVIAYEEVLEGIIGGVHGDAADTGGSGEGGSDSG